MPVLIFFSLPIEKRRKRIHALSEFFVGFFKNLFLSAFLSHEYSPPAKARAEFERDR
jgi:hypothetical protein